MRMNAIPFDVFEIDYLDSKGEASKINCDTCAESLLLSMVGLFEEGNVPTAVTYHTWINVEEPGSNPYTPGLRFGTRKLTVTEAARIRDGWIREARSLSMHEVDEFMSKTHGAHP